MSCSACQKRRQKIIELKNAFKKRLLDFYNKNKKETNNG